MQEILLVQKARNGDREALGRLVKKYYSSIYNYIYRRTSNKEIAEDLTQEVFLKLTKSIGRYIPVAKFSTFLYRIAHNTVIDFYRTERARVEEMPEQWEESKSRQVENKVLIEAILKKLPEEQRECVILYYYQQLKYREIAMILQIPVATAKTRVRRGLENCKKMIEQEQ